MHKEISTPYEWIKKIPGSIIELDATPLLGHLPPFPWVDFIQKFSKNLEIENLEIHPSEFQWRNVEELFVGTGGDLQPLSFSLPPFEGKLFWALPRQDIKDLMGALLFKNKNSAQIIEPEYEEAFYEFLALETIHIIESLKFDSTMTPKLLKNDEKPNTPMLCMDISIIFQNTTKIGRLFISPELQKSFALHYTKKSEKSPFTHPLNEKIEVILHLEAGSITLTENEWSTVKPGDVLILDHCAFKPGESQGEILITLKGHPFFKAEVKDGKVKILEHPLYQEVK